MRVAIALAVVCATAVPVLAQTSGQSAEAELRSPENDTTFFDKTDSPFARTTFERDAAGKIVAQTYRAQGQRIRATRVR